ncbi:MAG: HNH endonuclease [Chthoniobacteraceae bacterium]
MRERAGNRCEYCGLPEAAEPFFSFHIEHIVARQHGGGDAQENLACHHCNARKGTKLTAIDPAAGTVASLFHPRRH